MTAKEKAEELVGKFKKHSKENRTSLGATPNKFKNINHPKQCALIAVDEILLNEKENHSVLDKTHEYWEEVKQEIEKL